MLLRQRGATGGDGPRHAGLEGADDVGVALAHDDLTLFDDALLGPVERVEGATLRVDRRLLRVLVLRLGPVGRRRARCRRQDPPAERDRPPGRIADREQHAGPEEVLHAAAPIDEAEARVREHVLGQLERRGHGVPVVGRPAQTELAHHSPS